MRRRNRQFTQGLVIGEVVLGAALGIAGNVLTGTLPETWTWVKDWRWWGAGVLVLVAVTTAVSWLRARQEASHTDKSPGCSALQIDDIQASNEILASS